MYLYHKTTQKYLILKQCQVYSSIELSTKLICILTNTMQKPPWKLNWRCENSQRNSTLQVFEPLSIINNFWKSFLLQAPSMDLMIILSKTSLFFNKYLTSSNSSVKPSNPKISIFLTCKDKQLGTHCGSIHLRLSPTVKSSISWSKEKYHKQQIQCHLGQKSFTYSPLLLS